MRHRNNYGQAKQPALSTSPHTKCVQFCLNKIAWQFIRAKRSRYAIVTINPRERTLHVRPLCLPGLATIVQLMPRTNPQAGGHFWSKDLGAYVGTGIRLLGTAEPDGSLLFHMPQNSCPTMTENTSTEEVPT